MEGLCLRLTRLVYKLLEGKKGLQTTRDNDLNNLNDFVTV